MMLRKAVTGVVAGLAAASVVMTLGLAGCGGDNGANSGGNGGGGGGDDDNGGGGGGGGGGGNYKFVKIGTQTWMSENLNIDVQGSKCYDNSASNCAKYGRLYTWKAAKNACPSGWHLPSDAEWTKLTDFVGTTAGTKLKSKTGWQSSTSVPAGSDAFGFSALPGGYGHSGGSFNNADNYGIWWSATEDGVYGAWSRDMNYNTEIVSRISDDKADLISVRCVQD